VAETLLIRFDSSALAQQLRRRSGEMKKARGAVRSAHKEMGEYVRSTAADNLDRGLMPKRRRVAQAELARGWGIQAALNDKRIVSMSPQGDWWGVGNDATFERHHAKDYWRVIERGGGFVGDVENAFLLDENFQLTKSWYMNSPGNQRRMVELYNRERATAARQRAAAGKFAAKGRMPQAVQAQYAARNSIGRSHGFERLAGSPYRYTAGGGKRMTRRTGLPFKSWKNVANSAAMAVGFHYRGGIGGKATGSTRESNAGGGWTFRVRRRVKARAYLKNAMLSLETRDVISIYRKHLREAGIDLPLRRGRNVGSAEITSTFKYRTRFRGKQFEIPAYHLSNATLRRMGR